MQTNERQLIRHYKREHFNREVLRALKQLKFWLKDGDVMAAFLKVKSSYGDLIHSQVIYHLNKKLYE